MDNDLRTAVEGLRRLAVTFSAAEQIAQKLETFDAAESAAAGHLKRVADAEAAYSLLIAKMARLAERHQAEVDAINADAIKQAAELVEQIEAHHRTISGLDTDIAAREKQVQALQAQEVALNAKRAQLAKLLNGG